MYLKMAQESFNAKKNSLILDSRFKEVLNFLLARQDQVTTLRDIKREFPQIKHFDRYIDDLVTNNLLNRYHGRYTFAGNIISKNSQEELSEQINNWLKNQSEPLKISLKAELANLDSLVVFYHLFKTSKTSSISVYEEATQTKEWFLLPSRYTEFSCKKMTFFSMGNVKSNYGNNIVDYFNYLTLNQLNLPTNFVELRDKLGDLNPEYFINYCERKLRRLEKGKIISTDKADIFMEALSYMGYVKEVENQYQFNLIRLIEENDFFLLVGILEQLISISSDSDHDKNEQIFMIKCNLVQWLLEEKLISFPKTIHGVL